MVYAPIIDYLNYFQFSGRPSILLSIRQYTAAHVQVYCQYPSYPIFFPLSPKKLLLNVYVHSATGPIIVLAQTKPIWCNFLFTCVFFLQNRPLNIAGTTITSLIIFSEDETTPCLDQPCMRETASFAKTNSLINQMTVPLFKPDQCPVTNYSFVVSILSTIRLFLVAFILRLICTFIWFGGNNSPVVHASLLFLSFFASWLLYSWCACFINWYNGPFQCFVVSPPNYHDEDQKKKPLAFTKFERNRCCGSPKIADGSGGQSF